MIIDYSTFRPAMATLQHAGVTSVGRYLGWDCEPGHACIRKNLTKAEAAQLHAAGISIFVSFEYAANASLGGAAQGTKDAQLATRQLHDLGAPPGVAVYYSIDFDLGDYAPALPDTAVNARAKLGPVAHYFDAIHATKPAHAVAAYGGYYAVKRLFDAKLIAYGWQTAAWSGGQWDTRAVLRQLVQQVFGAADVNVHGTSSPDWGQWPRPAHGPYRHVTAVSQSVEDAAISRGASFTGLLAITARHYTPADFEAAGKVRAAGIPYYTAAP